MRPVIGLCGNPNVGKSTLFNCATGLKQHTGNWTGKTVGLQSGTARVDGRALTLVDVPGTYSLRPVSEEERTAAAFVTEGQADAYVVVLDGTSLRRSLPLALQGYAAAGLLSPAAAAGALGPALRAVGWTQGTALCFMAFSLLHFPCSTTLWTIKKETGSWGWCLLAALLPTTFGLLACLLIRFTAAIL